MSSNSRKRTQPPQPLSRWIFAVLIFVAIAIGIGTSIVLIANTNASSRVELQSAQMEAIRIGLSVGVGSGGIIVLYLAWRRQRISELALFQSSTNAGGRIQRIQDHMRATSELLAELEDELTTQTRLLEERQADAKRYGNLASLNAEQAQAIEDLIGRQFSRQQRATTLYWWAGLASAFVLGLLVNWISGPLLAWLIN